MLPLPLPWKPLQQPRERHLRLLPAIQDRLDDIRRKQGQAQTRSNKAFRAYIDAYPAALK